jgi:endonuclease/exonuclease/phosphatase family metal-dependent hydrolase
MHKADIVCLQELDLRDPMLDKDLQIRYLLSDYFSEFIPSPAVITNTGWYGNAMLSRHPYINKRSVDVSVARRQPRNIQSVLFNVNGQQLRVLNTHKGLKQYERTEQVKRLEQVVDVLQEEEDAPLLVAGDFNEWQLFAKSLRRLNDKLKSCKLGPTFPTKLPLFKLDRFWCQPDDLVSSVKVLKTKETNVYSDHYPIVANLVLD